MKKYGLQLRVQPSQQKKQPARPPLPPPLGFCDEDEDDVKKEISRQASKNKALKDIEEQHKKALEEDPSMFGYDGVYDEMKEKVVHPLAHLKKLAKERSKDDRLFADKGKFVTSAYKKKLADHAQWMEEECQCQLQEERG
ncbi:unnamed protein product [Camellia sinensis]